MRLFVAFELPEAVRQEAGRRLEAVRGELPAARWVAPELLHLTLKFLGETDPAALPGLTAALAPAFAAATPMTARLEGAGCFPPGRPARVAWLRLVVEDGGDEALAGLQRRVEEVAAERLGLEPERRPFTAHVTVARCQRPWGRAATARFEAALDGPVGPRFALAHGSLIDSRLGAGGPAYRAVAAFPLGG